MTTRFSRQSARLLAAFVSFGLALSEASAQQTIVPPKPGDIEGASPLPAYIVGFLLVGAALALTVFPSKRSHED